MVVLNPEKYMELLPNKVREALARVINVINEAFNNAWMPNKLSNAAYHYIRNKGKLIRPTLVLLTAYALSNSNGLERAVLPAASVEFIHMASLLQDDIMDKQRIRRGVETPYNLYGENMAMLASDLMIAKAVELAVRSGDNDVVFELINSSIKLAIGQGLELELNDRNYVTVNDYLKLIYYKTAALIESSMVVGAYSVNVKGEDLISNIRNVGRLVGLAFQLRDDILDYFNVDKQNPGINNNEINIIKILSINSDIDNAVGTAKDMLNNMLDEALNMVKKVLGDDVLINYINLLRI
ncbi:MAG: polyprenyl synthetase family protein [Vulcanisaeta sp. AZ3]|jgi:geranylgeranyl pyrophosphate synthase